MEEDKGDKIAAAAPTDQQEDTTENTQKEENAAEMTADVNSSPRARQSSSYPSPFCNVECISAHWRYGIPLLLVGTLTLLLASDIGSGVKGISLVVPPPGDTISKPTEHVLLHASVFSSIAELWHTGSYALAIFVVITSVSWPYVKILLSLYAWMTPMSCTRAATKRESWLAVVDGMGKWSFVDVVVFIEISVVFRATIPLPFGAALEVWVLPEWGIMGFLCATMMSLIATQCILYQHRKVLHPKEEEARLEGELLQVQGRESREAEGEPDPARCSRTSFRDALSMSLGTAIIMSFMFLTAFALYLAGVLIHIFRVMNSQDDVDLPAVDYSIVSVGRALPESGRASDRPGMRWLQIVWFLLGVAMPLANITITAVLLWLPLSLSSLRRLFFMTEVSFAWNCGEVFWLSTVFAVLEIPTFGNGLVDSGCPSCYVVDAALLPELTVMGVAIAINLISTLYIFRVGHKALYRPTYDSNSD